jgi:hypothetical protein
MCVMSTAMLCAVCALVGACDTCSAMGVYPVKSTRRTTVSRAAKTRDYRKLHAHSFWATSRDTEYFQKMDIRKTRRIKPDMHVDVSVEKHWLFIDPIVIETGDVARISIGKSYID